ncbi:hypothetical protein EYF80_011784 [Liparis tanakae]|uniref:Uncharacterized protein n=1 Tax=Liparis tanakae TaxID=230148 RepID=A0A4Z2IJ38_9TELE|nr:hypothetical protein EYF80_011784 [Liparis tanakae]
MSSLVTPALVFRPSEACSELTAVTPCLCYRSMQTSLLWNHSILFCLALQLQALCLRRLAFRSKLSFLILRIQLSFPSSRRDQHWVGQNETDGGELPLEDPARLSPRNWQEQDTSDASWLSICSLHFQRASIVCVSAPVDQTTCEDHRLKPKEMASARILCESLRYIHGYLSQGLVYERKQHVGRMSGQDDGGPRRRSGVFQPKMAADL